MYQIYRGEDTIKRCPPGILHSANWIWGEPDNDEEEESPQQVICGKEMGEHHFDRFSVQHIKLKLCQRGVRFIVIISQHT